MNCLVVLTFFAICVIVEYMLTRRSPMITEEILRVVCCECGKELDVPYWFWEKYGVWANLFYAHSRAWQLDPDDYSLTCTECQGIDDEEIWLRRYGNQDF